jgi:amidohydrolase
MSLIAEIEATHQEFTVLRRDIHAHPELAFKENRTSDLVAERLVSWGIEVHRGLGQTGVVGVLRGNRTATGGKPRAIGLRADMDALPMPEHNRFAHASRNEGRMHGCGHDGHTAMLLGAAKYLAAHPDFDGVVNFIFQPAEEGGNAGARAMMADGLFEKFPCDEIYGIHNMPGFPAGQFAFRKGPTMASSNRFDIIVRGTGGHAAQPHKSVDTIVIAAELVGVLQTLISRHKNPIDVAVVSVTQIHAGDAYNVLPGEAVIKGTVRTFSTQVLDEIENNMRRIAETLPTIHGGTGELKFHRAYPPLVNWDEQTDFAMKVAQDAFGADRVDGNTPQHGGAEDFSFYLQQVPGSYLFLGNGDGAGEHREERYIGMGPCELHNPNYDFNDALLPVGSTYWVKLAQAFFART